MYMYWLSQSELLTFIATLYYVFSIYQLFCDSDSVDITEYATLFSSSSRFVDFSSVVSGSLCELRSQTTSANQTEFKINLTLIRN